jgi:VWFA-related protein
MVSVCITQPAAQQPVFRSGVRLVQASVVVHDKSGRPVTDLKQSDFTIFEDGKEQKLELFTVEAGNAPASASAAPPMAAAPDAAVFNNRPNARVAGNTSVILFDRLNSSQEDQKLARDQIVTMLANTNPADRVAFYVLESAAVTVLHDFTSDTSRLIRILKRYQQNNSSVELLRSEEKPPEFAHTDDPAGGSHTETAGGDAETEAWLASTQEAVAEIYLRRRAELTTNALESIANHLAGVPGRKSLVWVSGAFPIIIPNGHGSEVMDRQVSRAARAINEANIAVYPVDIRGLIPVFNPTTVTETTIKGGQGPSQKFATVSSTQTNQDVMNTIADATGGRVYLNNNAIGELVKRAIDDSRVSYVLGYYAPRATPDGRFHDIRIKVNRSGVDVRHRMGYLSLAPVVNKDPKARLTALEKAMQSPIESTGLGLSARLENTSPSRGTIVVRIDPSALTWEMRNGVREGAIDIVIAQSTPDGKYFKIKETTANLTADADRYRSMLEDGFTVSSMYTLHPDAYRLHVIVSDVASQSIGSLVIPIRN